MYTDVFPALLNAAAVQAHSKTNWHELHVINVDMTASVVLAAGRRLFHIRKRATSMYITFTSTPAS